MKLYFTPLLLAAAFNSAAVYASAPDNLAAPQALGQYYPKKTYSGAALPTYEASKNQLPKIIFERRPDYIQFYTKAWQIGFTRFHKPPASSPLVSNYVDEAFNENIFMWDMSFATLWANYAHSIFPAIEGLDNFYRMQLPDGEIEREIAESDGKLGVKGWSEPGTPGNLNHPMLPWAELESYRITGNKTRLAKVYEPLVRFRESFKKIYDAESGFYFTDHGAMDDSPRNKDMRCGIDVAAEMVIFDRWLAEIATILEKHEDAVRYQTRASDYAKLINQKLWDDKTGFYYDWGKNGKRMEMRTIAAFWTLLAKIPDEKQRARLVEHLNNPKSFNTPHRVPSHPVDEKGFTATYWDGTVWAPTNTMVIEGLEANGEMALAHDIAMNHLNATTDVFRNTGTAWENYHPLKIQPGPIARPDFVGWSGLAPIQYLIRHAVGIRINAPENTLTWYIRETGKHGIENLRFGSPSGAWNRVSLVANKRAKSTDPVSLRVSCQNPFTLITWHEGKQQVSNIVCQGAPQKITIK